MYIHNSPLTHVVNFYLLSNNLPLSHVILSRNVRNLKTCSMASSWRIETSWEHTLEHSSGSKDSSHLVVSSSGSLLRSGSTFWHSSDDGKVKSSCYITLHSVYLSSKSDSHSFIVIAIAIITYKSSEPSNDVSEIKMVTTNHDRQWNKHSEPV